MQVQNDPNAVNSYTESREQALLQLIFDKNMKNASFILDNNLIEIIKSHPKQNLILMYNTMAAYGLNSIDSWKFLLSCTQSLVTCGLCQGPVLWHKSDINQSEKMFRFVYYYIKYLIKYVEDVISEFDMCICSTTYIADLLKFCISHFVSYW